MDARWGNSHQHPNIEYLDKYHPDKVQVHVDGVTMKGTGAVGDPLVSPRQGAVMRGPYKSLEDIPEPYDHNAVYIIDTGEPDANGADVYAPYMFDENDDVHRIGTLQPDLSEYSTIVQTDAKDTATLASANIYTDNKLPDMAPYATTEQVEAKDSIVLANAKSYADSLVPDLSGLATKYEMTEADAAILKSAQDYCDAKPTGSGLNPPNLEDMINLYAGRTGNISEAAPFSWTGYASESAYYQFILDGAYTASRNDFGRYEIYTYEDRNRLLFRYMMVLYGGNAEWGWNYIYSPLIWLPAGKPISARLYPSYDDTVMRDMGFTFIVNFYRPYKEMPDE